MPTNGYVRDKFAEDYSIIVAANAIFDRRKEAERERGREEVNIAELNISIRKHARDKYTLEPFVRA